LIVGVAATIAFFVFGLAALIEVMMGTEDTPLARRVVAAFLWVTAYAFGTIGLSLGVIHGMPHGVVGWIGWAVFALATATAIGTSLASRPAGSVLALGCVLAALVGAVLMAPSASTVVALVAALAAESVGHQWRDFRAHPIIL
jgi:hypothetical protein